MSRQKGRQWGRRRRKGSQRMATVLGFVHPSSASLSSDISLKSWPNIVIVIIICDVSLTSSAKTSLLKAP